MSLNASALSSRSVVLADGGTLPVALAALGAHAVVLGSQRHTNVLVLRSPRAMLAALIQGGQSPVEALESWSGWADRILVAIKTEPIILDRALLDRDPFAALAPLTEAWGLAEDALKNLPDEAAPAVVSASALFMADALLRADPKAAKRVDLLHQAGPADPPLLVAQVREVWDEIQNLRSAVSEVRVAAALERATHAEELVRLRLEGRCAQLRETALAAALLSAPRS